MRTEIALSDVFASWLVLEHGEWFWAMVLPVCSAVQQVPAGLHFNCYLFLDAFGALFGLCALVLRFEIKRIWAHRRLFECGYNKIDLCICCLWIQLCLHLSKFKPTALFIIRYIRYTAAKCCRDYWILYAVELGRVLADFRTLLTKFMGTALLGSCSAHHATYFNHWLVFWFNSVEHRFTNFP